MEPDSSPKNVMIIESGEGVGGSAFSMFRITKYLDKREYQPHVFVYFRTEVFRQIEERGVPVVKLRSFQKMWTIGRDTDAPLGKMLRSISLYAFLTIEIIYNGFHLARFIRKFNIEIVHCNNGLFENLAAAFAARLTKTPCVVHVRGTEPLARLEKLCRSWVGCFVVLNRKMLDHYSGAFGHDKVVLIGNGVDLEEFEDLSPTRVRSEFSIPDSAFCIGTFARLVEGKGIPEFLQIAAKVGRGQKDIFWFIAGGGDDNDSEFVDHLHELAEALGVRDRVIFAGWRDDAKDCMAAMDMILQISNTYPEGMSLSPIEAMALSKPLIVTDNPGYDNTVIDGQSGFIVKCGDVDRTAALVEQIIGDRQLSRRLGEGARQRVLDQFDYRIVATRIQEIYCRLSG